MLGSGEIITEYILETTKNVLGTLWKSSLFGIKTNPGQIAGSV